MPLGFLFNEKKQLLIELLQIKDIHLFSSSIIPSVWFLVALEKKTCTVELST